MAKQEPTAADKITNKIEELGEGEKLNKTALNALIRAAVAANMAKKK